jgi:hypothetical protein
MEIYFNAFLTSALDGCNWSASRHGGFINGETAPSTNRIGACMGPKPVWTLWRKESLLPLSGIEPQFLGCPSCSPIAISFGVSLRTTYRSLSFKSVHFWNLCSVCFHLIGHSVAFHAFYSFNLGRRFRITEHASCNWKEHSITAGSLSEPSFPPAKCSGQKGCGIHYRQGWGDEYCLRKPPVRVVSDIPFTTSSQQRS